MTRSWFSGFLRLKGEDGGAMDICPPTSPRLSADDRCRSRSQRIRSCPPLVAGVVRFPSKRRVGEKREVRDVKELPPLKRCIGERIAWSAWTAWSAASAIPKLKKRPIPRKVEEFPPRFQKCQPVMTKDVSPIIKTHKSSASRDGGVESNKEVII